MGRYGGGIIIGWEYKETERGCRSRGARGAPRLWPRPAPLPAGYDHFLRDFTYCPAFGGIYDGTRSGVNWGAVSGEPLDNFTSVRQLGAGGGIKLAYMSVTT